MKITFINPKFSQNIRSSNIPARIKTLLEKNSKLKEKINFANKSMSCLGMLTIASVVPKDLEIEFLDENMEDINLDQKFDLVAIGGNSSQFNRAIEIIDKLRNKNIPIVAGGNAVLTFPEQYIKRKIHVIIGEAENLFKKFLTDFLNGNAKQVYDENSGEIHIDLNDTPIPRYDIAAKYKYTMVGIQISRGCPYNCSFCQVTKIYGKKYRHKSMQQIIEELKLVKKYWNDSFLFFYDDNPFFNRDFSIKLFNEIYKEKIQLGKWGANANVTLYKDLELMKILTKEYPISFLGIGLESLSEESLNSINNKMKLNYVKEYETAIKILKSNNIIPVAYFMFGFQNSKKKDLKDIVNFCIKNKINGIITRVTPMPGTTLYNELKSEYQSINGKIKKSSLGEWGMIRNYLTKKTGLSENEMQECLADAFDILFSDDNFNDDELFPFYFLF